MLLRITGKSVIGRTAAIGYPAPPGHPADLFHHEHTGPTPSCGLFLKFDLTKCTMYRAGFRGELVFIDESPRIPL